jgi:hypothetical protein
MDWKHYLGIAIVVIVVLAVVKFAKSKSEVVDKYL